MKKILILIISIIVVLFGSIIIINNMSSYKDLDIVSKAFLINNDKDSIKSIKVYSSNSLYYIIENTKDNKEFVAVLDNKEKIILDIEKDKLFNINEKNYIYGYKYDKLIYEIKEDHKNGFVYYYYDALNGELIKKINMDK